MSASHDQDQGELAEGLSPGDAVSVAIDSWTAEEFMDSTVTRMSEVAQRFARRVTARPTIGD